MPVQRFTARVKLNMVNGLGDKVFNSVKNANVPGMIATESNGNGRVIDWFFEWDEGWTNHDLYLVYLIDFDCKAAVQAAAGKRASSIINWFGLTDGIVAMQLQSALRNGFAKEMPGWSAIASLQSCSIIEGHHSQRRW